MAEDDLISAMWRSLVPTVDGSERAIDVEASPVDYRNPYEMVVEEVITADYAEPEQNYHLQAYQNMKPMDYWINPQEMMVLHEHPQAVGTKWNGLEEVSMEPETSVEMQLALSDSMQPQQTCHLQLQYADPINYWNQLQMLHGYQKPDNFIEEVAGVSMDIKSLTNSMQIEALSDDLPVVKKFYVVPPPQHKNNDDYDPQFLPIGPYHGDHDSTVQQNSLKYKRHYRKLILQANTSISLREYYDALKRWEKNVRAYYYEDTYIKRKKEYHEQVIVKLEKEHRIPPSRFEEWESWAFKRDLLLDACSILGFLGILESQKALPDSGLVPYMGDQHVLITPSDFNSEPTDHDALPTVPKSHLNIHAMRDILLMENQMPFFVVEEIYKVAVGEEKGKLLRRQIVESLHKNLERYPTSIGIDDVRTQRFVHILHYCHMYFTPLYQLASTAEHDFSTSLTTVTNSTAVVPRWHRAIDLHNMGINLKKISKDSGRSLLDVRFENGVLEIPTLIVDGSTCSFFRNIIALESTLDTSNSSYLLGNYFRAYVKFIGDLMTSPADVALLARKRIIENHLKTDKAIIDLFNKLMGGVILKENEKSYLTPMYRELEEYFNSRPRKWMANLRQNYFKSPGLIIGAVAGTATVIFAAISAIYALKDHL